ncbi:MAG: class I SAM-dependent methyltransferase [Deltaproteobacteria bacterium]|nr:MAG: class I SAM-dependent methyltransferase [Deltaproteobacteria bacterium]
MQAAEALVAERSARWILAHLPAGARVLDVGCGPGAVAARLAAAGHPVVGLDVDPQAVEAAKARGIDARLEDIREHAGGNYDAIVFAWSLHHVRDLEGALDAAWARLRPGGRLLVLEMAFDEVDEKTKAWARTVEALLLHAGAVEETGCIFFAYEGGRPHGHHAEAPHPHETHDFHPSRRIWAALEARFRPLESERCPILHVFLARALGDRSSVLEDVIALETHAVEHGAIVPVGRLWVFERT